MLVIVREEDEPGVERLVGLPVQALVATEDEPGDLLRSVCAVLDGRSWLSPVLSGRLAGLRRASGKADGVGARVSLTARQREIFELLREGVARGDTARRLNVSAFTVDVHRRQIEKKLGKSWRTSGCE